MTMAVMDISVEEKILNYKSKQCLNNTEDLRFDTAIFYILKWVIDHQSKISIKNFKMTISAKNIEEYEIGLLAQLLQFLSNTALYFEYYENENIWVLDLNYIKNNFKEIFLTSTEC